MKTFTSIGFFLALLTAAAFCGIDDPVKDYLTNRENVYMRGDDTFYADDVVYVLDLDLRGNGQTQRLVSSSLDRDGKAGSAWTVFDKVGNSWKRIGQITFPGSRFYLGKIDELNGRYGVVFYVPSGAGEGSVMAGYLVGSTAQEKKIGEVERDYTTGQLKGTKYLEKYLGDGTGETGHPIERTMDVNELAKTYGLKNDSRHFEEALREKHGAGQAQK
jgi:hypothetical protein